MPRVTRVGLQCAARLPQLRPQPLVLLRDGAAPLRLPPLQVTSYEYKLRVTSYERGPAPPAALHLYISLRLPHTPRLAERASLRSLSLNIPR